MFEPVRMTRLRLVILERDERAVLRHLGRVGVMQLTRTPAGPDTAPLSPRNRSEELARLERLSSRLENLRRSLCSAELHSAVSRIFNPLATASGEAPPIAESRRMQFGNTADYKSAQRQLPSHVAKPPAPTEKNLQRLEEQSNPLLQRRQQLQQRLAEMSAVSEQISDYRELDLPLDRPDESSFLHFVTGSLPARNFSNFAAGGAVAVLPLAERNGRQILIALTTRQNRPGLDRALQQAGFQPEKLPAVAGATTAALSEQNQREQEQAVAELKELNAKLQALAEKSAPTWAQMEMMIGTERRLLEAEQNFPRTESSVLVSGWIPSGDFLELKQRIHGLTNGCGIIEGTPAEQNGHTEIPVLLRQPRLLRPFAMLVTAYGLPTYGELEPTLFVAVSYLLMFGMMFGDVGHGFVFALGRFDFAADQSPRSAA